MKTWCVEARRWPRVLLGWVRFQWRSLWCRHEWRRDALLDFLSHLGTNKCIHWQCARCGKVKWKSVW